MIAVTLVLGFLGTLGLSGHLLFTGEFVESFKALVTSGGFFALLSLRISLFRVSHGR